MDEFTDPHINDIPLCSKTIGKKSKIKYLSLFLKDLNKTECADFYLYPEKIGDFSDGFFYWVHDKYAKLKYSSACAYVFSNSISYDEIKRIKFSCTLSGKGLYFNQSS